MDPSTRLDYVLFQLTPTRTRCDLVIFAGKSNEKLAYGLLEPFIAHLRSAKDQISKGGYSVTLRPPSSSIAHWFTKATLQRFVRFVSTPEVLERFVTIEREISQLENSIKSYEASNGDPDLGAEGNSKQSGASFKSKSDFTDGSDAAQEENSKARLQRVVETRKAVLRKEQAMVYARALAAGFEMDNLDDLLWFSDAFGASRLREACINFKELCKKKNEDRLWVDEIAAMQAIVQPDLSYLGTSGIILAGEDDPAQNFVVGGKQNGSTDLSLSDSMTSHGSSDANQENGAAQTLPTDAKAQMPNPWANQFPPYYRAYQQMPPYQGYVFPGMQAGAPYYPPNMQWTPNADRESHDRRSRKSSSKKDKASKLRGSENEELDESTEPSGSSSETESDSSPERSRKKRNGKKSSRKVVIRNINYITSKNEGEKNGDSEEDSSDEEDYLDGDSLKQQVEDAVGSFEKHQKSSRHHRKRNGSKHRSSVNGSTDQDGENASLKNNGNKGNENWDAFQQLLLKDEPDNNGPEPHPVRIDEEHFASAKSVEPNPYPLNLEAEGRPKQRPVATDAFLVTEKGMGDDSSTANIAVGNFDPIESSRPAMKKGSAPEEFLFSQRIEEPESYARVTLSDDTARSSVIRSQTGEDWFVSKHSNEAAGENGHFGFIEGDYVRTPADQVEKKKKDVVFDDSLMIQGMITDEHRESQRQTDISLVSDVVEASFIENGMAEVPQKKAESQGFYEPVDLYMVRDRDTVVEEPVPSWTPEMDYENNVCVKKDSEADVSTDSNMKSNDKGPNNKKTGASVTKTSTKDARSRVLGGPLRKSKPETTPGTKRSTFGSRTSVSRNQAEKEEERRKRIEELALERQKRIAERSASRGGSPATAKKAQTGKSASPNAQRSKLQSPAEETKKAKPILRTSTIERLAAAKTSPKVPSDPPKKEVSKVNNGSRKTAGADLKKVKMNKIGSSEKKAEEDENVVGVSSSISEPKEEKITDKVDAVVPSTDLPVVQRVDASDEVDDSTDIKEVDVTSSVVNKEVNIDVQTGSFDEKVGSPLEDHSTKPESVVDSNNEISEASVPFPQGEKISEDNVKVAPEMSIHPMPESPTKPVASPLIVDEKTAANGNVQNYPEISEVHDSTPPQNDMNVDPIQSRKKWGSAENSPKAAKGFRKLLMFGRKS